MQQGSSTLDLKGRTGRTQLGPVQGDRRRVSIRKAHDHRGPAACANEPNDGHRHPHHRVNRVRDDDRFRSLIGQRGVMR